MYYTAKIPWVIKLLFPDLLFKIKNKEKVIYITFDDGPNPQTTPLILDILEKYSAKATFFCLGKNVDKYPELFDLIKQKGHSIGNHTFNHKNGWKTKNREYFDDIEKADNLINSKLFRPPYGRLTPYQIKILKKKYKIVMWDVISGDFDPDIKAEKCYENVMRHCDNGSIVVFHDSTKAKHKVLKVLPKVLDRLKGLEFKFEHL